MLVLDRVLVPDHVLGGHVLDGHVLLTLRLILNSASISISFRALVSTNIEIFSTDILDLDQTRTLLTT